MSLLNGIYEFYFSKSQKEKKIDKEMEGRGYFRPVFVIIPADDPDQEGDRVEYTECVAVSNKDNWKPHSDRFEDSKFLGKVKTPYTEKGGAHFKRDEITY